MFQRSEPETRMKVSPGCLVSPPTWTSARAHGLSLPQGPQSLPALSPLPNTATPQGTASMDESGVGVECNLVRNINYTSGKKTKRLVQYQWKKNQEDEEVWKEIRHKKYEHVKVSLCHRYEVFLGLEDCVLKRLCFPKEIWGLALLSASPTFFCKPWAPWSGCFFVQNPPLPVFSCSNPTQDSRSAQKLQRLQSRSFDLFFLWISLVIHSDYIHGTFKEH